MGGQGSGRPRIFSDQYHEVMRNQQLKYLGELKTIMEEFSCDRTTAQRIRIERKKVQLKMLELHSKILDGTCKKEI